MRLGGAGAQSLSQLQSESVHVGLHSHPAPEAFAMVPSEMFKGVPCLLLTCGPLMLLTTFPF